MARDNPNFNCNCNCKLNGDSELPAMLSTEASTPVAPSVADLELEKEDGIQEATLAREERDFGLQLTCSMRSGIGPQELQLEDPPDGGMRAWLQVLGVHLSIFSTWGFINAYGVFQSYYVDALDSTPSAVSWIGSLQIFQLFFLGTFTGRALDGGFFFTVYRTGTVCIVVGIFLTSLGTKYWHIFLSQAVLTGFGMGLIFCPSVALTSTYFKRKRALAIGIGASGSATGGIIIPVMVNNLLPKVGFPWTMRALGFLTLFLLICANLILRPRVAPRKTGPLVEWSAFKEPTYVLFAAGCFLIFMGLYFAFYYISTFAKSQIGLSQSTAFNTLIIMNSVGLPGRVIPNHLADRFFGPLNMVLPLVVGVGVLFLCWQAVHTYAGLVVWACFYGIVAAGFQSLFPATLSSLTTDMSKAGTRMGMTFSIVSFACLTGTPIGGALIQAKAGSYEGAQIFAGVVVLAGALIAAAARVCKVGWKLKVRA